MAENIGFIGLGVMGTPMAKHLIAAGHHLTVHNRSRGAVDELVGAGATAAAAPAEVARASTIVITMLPDTPDVSAVVEGADGLSVAVMAAGKLWLRTNVGSPNYRIDVVDPSTGARRTVVPARSTGSRCATGVRAPVRPTCTVMSSTRVVFSSAGNL